jgi:hypothetical protein
MKIPNNLIDKLEDCSFVFKETEYEVRTYGGHTSSPTISFDSPKGIDVTIILDFDGTYFSIRIGHEPFLSTVSQWGFTNTEELPQPLQGMVTQALKGTIAFFKDPTKFRETVNQNLLDKL